MDTEREGRRKERGKTEGKRRQKIEREAEERENDLNPFLTLPFTVHSVANFEKHFLRYSGLTLHIIIRKCWTLKCHYNIIWLVSITFPENYSLAPMTDT